MCKYWSGEYKIRVLCYSADHIQYTVQIQSKERRGKTKRGIRILHHTLHVSEPDGQTDERVHRLIFVNLGGLSPTMHWELEKRTLVHLVKLSRSDE